MMLERIRLGIQQRVLPDYRVPFFDLLADNIQTGLSVFAGDPMPHEGILGTTPPASLNLFHANNLHIFRGTYYSCYQSNLTRWLSDWQPDVLIVEANPRYLSTPAAIRWMKSRGWPVIGWGLGAPSRNGLLAGFFELKRKAFIQSFDAIITYSRQGAEEYQGNGYPPEKIFVACNAVSHRPAHPPQERPPYFNRDKASVVFVGRLQKRKRIELLLQACASLPKDSQPDLVIVGDGPDSKQLTDLAKEFYPAARFVGSQHGAALTELYNQADLFVLPGTGGLAVQQAMSHGLPVIVAEADGTQSDLVRPENGWIIPPGDLQALQDTLHQALLDVNRLREMGKKSYQIVRDEINLEQMVQTFIEAIQSARKGSA